MSEAMLPHGEGVGFVQDEPYTLGAYQLGFSQQPVTQDPKV